MAIYRLIKEETGYTIARDGEERFFGSGVVPDFYVKANTIVLTIGRFEYKISTSDFISIDNGSGPNDFSGTIAELKEQIKPVFFSGNSSGGGVTSYNDLADKPFTSVQINALKQILGVDNPDNT